MSVTYLWVISDSKMMNRKECWTQGVFRGRKRWKLNHSEVFIVHCNGTDTMALNVYRNSEAFLCSEGAKRAMVLLFWWWERLVEGWQGLMVRFLTISECGGSLHMLLSSYYQSLLVFLWASTCFHPASEASLQLLISLWDASQYSGSTNHHQFKPPTELTKSFLFYNKSYSLRNPVCQLANISPTLCMTPIKIAFIVRNVFFQCADSLVSQ